MRLLAVDDNEFELDRKEPGVYLLHQQTSGYKARISEDVYVLITCLKDALTIEEAIIEMKKKGYNFTDLSKRKLYNTINLLLQYGVIVPIKEKEFSPVIKGEKKSIKSLNLAVYDLESLLGQAAILQDNHPYPSNVLDTMKKNS